MVWSTNLCIVLRAGLTIRHTRQNLGPTKHKIKANDPPKKFAPQNPKVPRAYDNLNPGLTVPKCTTMPKMRKRGYTILHILFSSQLMVKGENVFSFKIELDILLTSSSQRSEG